MSAGKAIDDNDDFSWHFNFKSREENRLEIYVFHHEWVFHSHQAMFKWIHAHKATQIVKNTIESMDKCQCHPLPGHQLLQWPISLHSWPGQGGEAILDVVHLRVGVRSKS